MMKARFHILSISIILLSLVSCAQTNTEASVNGSSNKRVDLDSMQVAYFASGCFWCVEEVYESVNGVAEVISGYSGGKEVSPTYEQVGSGMTGHAEAVMVYYDSAVVSYRTLVEVFFNSHDPTTKDRQGPDRGRQYRSIGFYTNQKEKEILEHTIDSLIRNDVFPVITTEVVRFDVFYPAEDYHQNYVKLHPEQPYVKAVSIPRYQRFVEKMPFVLKQ